MMKAVILFLICFALNTSTGFPISTNHMNEPPIEKPTDLFLYQNDGRYYIIRHKRIVEVSEVIQLENNYIYLYTVSDSAPALYKKIMLLADVYCQSFPDREAAEICLTEIKKNTKITKENWMKNFLLDHEDSINKEK